MAHAEFDMRNIGRRVKGKTRPRSVVAAAAYRAGVRLEDERYATTHNYARKQGILYQQFIAPTDAPQWAQHRNSFWNRVEQDVTRKDARLAREAVLILPRGLEERKMIELVKGYVNDNFVAKGMCADVAIHRGKSRDGHAEGNPHAHVLLSCRGFSDDGGWAQYSAGGNGPNEQPWYSKKQLCEWRKAFADRVNQYLEAAGEDYRATAFFHERRDRDRKPEPRMGKAAAMEDKGKATDRGAAVRKVRHENELRAFAQTMRNRFSSGQGRGAPGMRNYFAAQGKRVASATQALAKKAGRVMARAFTDLKERLQLKQRHQPKEQQQGRGHGR